jgi:hypothetical protein
MNVTLAKASKCDHILAVSGFNPRGNSDGNILTPVLSYRFFGWGFAMTDKMLSDVNWFVDEEITEKQLASVYFQSRCNLVGHDLQQHLRNLKNGLVNGLDVVVDFNAVVYGKHFVAPSVSLTTNIGLDGSGEHSRKVDFFGEFIRDREIKYDEIAVIEYDFNFLEGVANIYTRSLWRRVLRYLMWKIRIMTRRTT